MKTKRVISLVLAMAPLWSMMPMAAFATEEPNVTEAAEITEAMKPEETVFDESADSQTQEETETTEESENNESDLSHEHHYDTIVTDPTCTEKGYTTYTCGCGDSYVADLQDAKGHEPGAWEHVRVPTAQMAGLDQRVCNLCGEIETQKVDGSWQKYNLADHLQDLPDKFCCGTNIWKFLTPEEVMINHHGEWVKAGSKVYSITIPIKPGDRIYANSFVEKGIQVSFIGDYGIIKTLFSADTKKAFLKNGCLIAPEGSIAVNVPVWNVNDENNTVNILNYDHVQGVFKVDVTCTEDGYTKHGCLYCDQGEIRDVQKAPGHHEVVQPGVAATCTADGLTDGRYCDVCNEVLTEQEVIPAGHTTVAIPAITPSVSHKGMTSGLKCEDCGNVFVAQKELAEVVELKDYLRGMRVSILGDSISTYLGVSNDADRNTHTIGNVAGYRDGGYYTNDDVTSVDLTWWMQSIQAFDMELLVNHASGSGRLLSTPSNGTLPAYYDEKCLNLHDNTGYNNGLNPDIIAVYIGVNDGSRKEEPGSLAQIDFTELIKGTKETEYQYAAPKTMAEGYAVMLHKMQNRYPDAEIFLFTIPRLNAPVPEYRLVIKDLAAHFDVHVVDLYDSVLTQSNRSKYFLDGTHPNAEGMKVIADMFQAELLNLAKELHRADTHRYSPTVTNPTCTEQGYTTYTCDICGDSFAGDYVEAAGHSYKNGICTACDAEHPKLANYKGKVISILGDSISTFAGYIPAADGFNLKHYARYPQDNLFTEVEHTWWMQTLTALDAKLGINESWRSTEVYNYIDAEVNSSYDGTKACMASVTRIQNLGSNGTPDVILFYGGTNDITQRRPIGSFDPATAPDEVDLVSVKWDTVADAYVDAIMRMQHYYPDAEIVAMLPTFTYKNTDAVIEGYNSVFAAICKHYGVAYVDLRACGISTRDLPDGTHPDAAGMDYITEAVMDVLMSDCQVEAGEHIVHSVTHNLKDAKSSLSYYKGVSHGKPFVTTITGENLKVTVTMGGTDITALCYANGVVSVENVTGDLVVAASGIPKTIYDDYLQELPEDLCAGTNLWTALEPINLYYTANGWGHNASGSAYSITIAISEGDQIWATSFQKSGVNGGTGNGIRLTWFNETGVLKSLSPQTTYAEYIANGCLTAPKGAVAVNVVMWNGDESNEVYILNREHNYGSWEVTKAATAQSEGEEQRLCGVCNAAQTRKLIPIALTAKVEPRDVTVGAKPGDVKIRLSASLAIGGAPVTDLELEYIITDESGREITLEQALQKPGKYTITPVAKQ